MAGGFVAGLAALMLFTRPVPQPQEYHAFADQRALIRAVPHTLNVLSNVAFAAAGIAGLLVTRRAERFGHHRERDAAILFFAAVLLTAAGSATYHLRPVDPTLALDRLAMAVAFMSLLSMLLYGRGVRPRALLPGLIVCGVASVLWWRLADDLRPYAVVQFGAIIVIAFLALRPSRYTGERPALALVLVLYGAAKICEELDAGIFMATGEAISGHTLKHLLAAAAPLVIALWVRRRDLRVTT